MIKFFGSSPYVTLPLQEWIAHCRSYGYNPVPQDIREIQAAIEQRAWTEILEPIIRELGLLSDENYDYLSIEDVETVIEAIRKLREQP